MTAHLPPLIELRLFALISLQFCPKMKKIGNLLSWAVSEAEYNEFVNVAEESGHDIEIMNKKMVMR